MARHGGDKLSDTADQNMRQLATAYYARVCSLDLSIFDTKILETRTMLFFRCFEEQCASFNSITAIPDSRQALNYITGQCYKNDGGTTLRSGRSMQSSLYEEFIKSTIMKNSVTVSTRILNVGESLSFGFERFNFVNNRDFPKM